MLLQSCMHSLQMCNSHTEMHPFAQSQLHEQILILKIALLYSLLSHNSISHSTSTNMSTIFTTSSNHLFLPFLERRGSMSKGP